MSEVPAAEVVIVASPALGPGDDEPRAERRGDAAPIRGPLAPGDDDPLCKVAGTALEASAPALPGDGPDASFDMVVQAAAGPGDTAGSARRLTLIPKKSPAPVAPVAITETESSPRRSRRSTQGA